MSFKSQFKSRLSLFQVRGRTQAPAVLGLTEDDIVEDLTHHGANDRLLERYTVEQVRAALEQYGVWKAIAEKGYADAVLKIRSLDPFRQSVRIQTSEADPEDEDHLLCELRVFDAWLNGKCPLTGREMEIDALVIDWLVFQHPLGSFTPDRPRLPGQKYPGLGIMRTCMLAILDLARQTGKEAVINIPEYYHNAVLYQPAFHFYSAAVEGRFLALQDLFAGKSLAEASNLIASRAVMDDLKGESFVWKPHEQVLGLVPRIVEYFAAPLYRESVEKVRREARFRLTPA